MHAIENETTVSDKQLFDFIHLGKMSQNFSSLILQRNLC